MLNYYADWSELCGEHLCSRASARPAVDVLGQCLAIGKLQNATKDLCGLKIGSAFSMQSLWLDALNEAEDIDRQLEEWEKSMSGRWQRRNAVHRLSFTTIEVRIEYYSDIQIGKVWNQCRCARISLHITLIQILEHLICLTPDLRDKLVSKLKRSAQIITTMLAAICDSIPFHLQQIDSQGELLTQTSLRVLGGEHLLWPLEVVFTNPWSTDSQRSQAKKILEETGTSLGLRQASRVVARGNAVENISCC